MKVYQGVMRGRTIRALCAAGLFALCADGALADLSAQKTTGTPLDLTAYNTAGDFDSIAPRVRLVGQFDLGPVTAIPGLTLGPAELTTCISISAPPRCRKASGPRRRPA
jgi:hypothetical protein